MVNQNNNKEAVVVIYGNFMDGGEFRNNLTEVLSEFAEIRTGKQQGGVGYRVPTIEILIKILTDPETIGIASGVASGVIVNLITKVGNKVYEKLHKKFTGKATKDEFHVIVINKIYVGDSIIEGAVYSKNYSDHLLAIRDMNQMIIDVQKRETANAEEKHELRNWPMYDYDGFVSEKCEKDYHYEFDTSRLLWLPRGTYRIKKHTSSDHEDRSSKD